MTDTNLTLDARFPARDVKTRSQGGKNLHYIDIPHTIRRFNEVLGSTGWSINRASSVITEAPAGGFLATSEIWVDLHGDETATKYGVGAMVNKDPDMAVKTALAEAIKKAGHQLGIGLQLWDERERDLVDLVTDATQSDSGGRLAGYKSAVSLLATIEGVTLLNAATIAEHFGVDENDLQDEETLLAILRRANLV